MKIQEYDHGRFLIESDSGEEYLVDILENKGIGWCSCLGFLHCQKRIEKKLPGSKRCRHLRWLYEVLKTVKERERTNEHETTKTNQEDFQSSV